jgi:hypothetical protein
MRNKTFTTSEMPMKNKTIKTNHTQIFALRTLTSEFQQIV